MFGKDSQHVVGDMRQSGEVCLLGDDSIIAWHRSLVEDGVLFADDKQNAAVTRLQAFADNVLSAPAHKKRGRLSEIFLGLFSSSASVSKPEIKKCGLYLHGGVGRGKSFLMDGFYLQLQSKRKLRVHFHQFMRRFHEDMKTAGGNDPLPRVAADICRKCDILCFDEFHVSDIADAMILGRLLQHFFDNGMRMVMTSNYHPNDLYPNGLARDRFLPTIALLESSMEVFALDGDEDYRLRHISEKGRVFFSPASAAHTQLQKLFDTLACGINLPPRIKIGGREIAALARSSDAIWFSFAQLCGGALGQGDYLYIASRFATVIVSDMPRLDDQNLSEESRRFTWLVDILYDARVVLVISADASMDELYGDSSGGESGRTLSRLIEMQSPDYWQSSGLNAG